MPSSGGGWGQARTGNTWHLELHGYPKAVRVHIKIRFHLEIVTPTVLKGVRLAGFTAELPAAGSFKMGVYRPRGRPPTACLFQKNLVATCGACQPRPGGFCHILLTEPRVGGGWLPPLGVGPDTGWAAL